MCVHSYTIHIYNHLFCLSTDAGVFQFQAQRNGMLCWYFIFSIEKNVCILCMHPT